MKMKSIFMQVVNAIAAIPRAYEESMNEYHKQIRDLPPGTQAYLYASMHLRR